MRVILSITERRIIPECSLSLFLYVFLFIRLIYLIDEDFYEKKYFQHLLIPYLLN